MSRTLTPSIMRQKSGIWSNDDGSFPRTPNSKRSQASHKSSSDQDEALQTPTPNLRERRGHRKMSETLFRPISVLTQSVLMPFNFDAERTFDIIRSGQRPQVAPPRKCHGINTSDQRATPRKPLSSKSTTPSTISSNSAALEALPFSGRCAMDLLTALRTTSPEKDYSPHQVKADYATLTEIPVPDLRDHPAFSASPFVTSSDSPMLLTTSSPAEIRTMYSRASIIPDGVSRASESGDESKSVNRKKSFFGFEVKTPTSTRKKGGRWSADASPISLGATSFVTLDTRSSIQAATPSQVEPEQERRSTSSGNSNGGIRKFSYMFKAKSHLNKHSPPYVLSTSHPEGESPNLERQDLEFFLRRTTYSPSYDFDPANAYPRHPITGRGWRSRNLKCTTCTEESCACCNRCCCAYKAAVLALENHKDSSPSRQEALLRVQEITKLFPYGKEAPTFLQCTRSSDDGGGCGRLVCPDCCSICPDKACGDTQCKKCKPLMWEECTWHRNDTLSTEYYKPLGLGIST